MPYAPMKTFRCVRATEKIGICRINESESEIYIQGIRSDRVPEDLRMEVRDTVEEAVIKTIPKKKMQKSKTVV